MIITKKRIDRILKELEFDKNQMETENACPEEQMKNYYWSLGNKNAINYIRFRLKIKE